MHSLEYGGFGKRPGFGLNTYKASIKLTLFFAIFLDPYYSVKTGGKAKGQEGTVFGHTVRGHPANTFTLTPCRSDDCRRRRRLAIQICTLFLPIFQSSRERLEGDGSFSAALAANLA